PQWKYWLMRRWSVGQASLPLAGAISAGGASSGGWNGFGMLGLLIGLRLGWGGGASSGGLPSGTTRSSPTLISFAEASRLACRMLSASTPYFLAMLPSVSPLAILWRTPLVGRMVSSCPTLRSERAVMSLAQR